MDSNTEAKGLVNILGRIRQLFKKKSVIVIGSTLIILSGASVAVAMGLHTQQQAAADAAQKSAQASEMKRYVEKVKPVINSTKIAINNWNNLQNKIKSGKISADQISSQIDTIKSSLNNVSDQTRAILPPQSLKNLNDDLKKSLSYLSSGIPSELTDQTDYDGLNISINNANEGLKNYSTNLKNFLSSHNAMRLYESQLDSLLPLPETSECNKPINMDDVKNLVLNYQNSMVQAINQNNFSIVEQFLLQGSKIYSDTQSLITNYNKQGLQEELSNHSIVSLQPGDADNTYKVDINATFKINNNNTSEKVMEESDEFTVYDDGKKPGLTDVKVLSTKTDSETSLTQQQAPTVNAQVQQPSSSGDSTTAQDNNQNSLVPPSPEGLSSVEYDAYYYILGTAKSISGLFTKISIQNFNNMSDITKSSWVPYMSGYATTIENEKGVLNSINPTNPYLVKYRNIVNNIIDSESTNLKNIAAALTNGDTNTLNAGLKKVSADDDALIELEDIMTNNFHSQN